MFYQLGRHIERADQTTRLLDVKYHLLLPGPEPIDSPLDVSQWNAVLRSAAAYHAFRQLHPRGMRQESVMDFLMFHLSFPRSVRACVAEVDGKLRHLKHTYRLSGGAAAVACLAQLESALVGDSANQVIETGLHEYLDWIRLKLNAVNGDLSQVFCGYAEVS